MPRYFFDIDDGTERRDEVGTDLESGADLRSEALRVVAGLVAIEALKALEWALILTVRDESGAAVLTIQTACQVEKIIQRPA